MATLGGLKDALQRLIDTGSLQIMTYAKPLQEHTSERREWLERLEILSLWDQLAGLSKLYEDLHREAYLPTAAGVMITPP